MYTHNTNFIHSGVKQPPTKETLDEMAMSSILTSGVRDRS